MPTKVLLCDTADGLAQLQYALLKSGAALELEVVTDGFRAVEVAARTQPEIVVTEVGLEGLGGGELIRRLIATVPETSVICWTNAPSPLVAAEMLAAGASAYVLKTDGPDGVFRAMRAVHAGNVALSPTVAGQVADRLTSEASRRSRLEKEISEVTAELESLTSAKADFLANISHELRTPVTVAKGIAYVLKNRGIPEEEQEEFLGQLEASLDKLMMLVDEMLTIADLDRGTLKIRLDEVDLAPVLSHVATEIARQYPSVEIVREIPEVLEGAADPVRFAEIVRQLLDNACRYTNDAQPVVLKGRAMDEGVVISVTDGGDGMPRQTVSKAFEEPFATGEEILRKERSGVGVGLHMARQLVLQHGGIMWADPVPAGGMRVSFVIPTRPGERAVRPQLGDPSLPARPDAGSATHEQDNVVPLPQRSSNASSS